MRMRASQMLMVLLIVMLLAPTVLAGTLNGTVKLGGIFMDERGDRTSVQETYNIFNGFSVNQIYLNGTPTATDHFTLDLRELTLDSRKGSFVYRRPGVFKLTADYDRNRQLFAPDAGIDAWRNDWKFGAQYSPTKWLGVFGNFNYLCRDGDRASYPLGTMSVLGTRYDNALKVGQVTVQAQRGRRGAAITYCRSQRPCRVGPPVYALLLL
jgi:hypothetical protein